MTRGYLRLNVLGATNPFNASRVRDLSLDEDTVMFGMNRNDDFEQARTLLVERIEASSDSTKPCPDCAETIKAGAKVCRYCGYRFGDSAR